MRDADLRRRRRGELVLVLAAAKPRRDEQWRGENGGPVEPTNRAIAPWSVVPHCLLPGIDGGRNQPARG
jgi:hypothetical protein